MASPNISFRKRSPRRFIVPVLVSVVVIAALLAFIGSRGSSPAKKAAEKTPRTAFTLTSLQVFSEGTAVATATAQPQRTAIVTMLDDYYQTAFVDPKKWNETDFATLKAAFTPDAQKKFDADITSLTIGEGRTDFARVDRPAGQLKISFYYDAAGKPTLAVATVHFTARATTKSKRPVDVVQDATYRLRLESGKWLIYSYTAKASQDTPAPPTPSPTAS